MARIIEKVECDQQVVNVLSKLTPKSTNQQKLRIGRGGDGGYVLLDMLINPGIVYSFGVGGSYSFEIDMANRGYTNYMYDHTVNNVRLPDNGNFVFKKIGIGSNNTPPFKTIETILQENNHDDRNDIILQCDIESSEWNVFNNIETLNHFSQICIELHDIVSFVKQENDFNKFKRTIDTLTTNFTVFHIHGNNNRGAISIKDQVVPDVLEISLVRNDLVTLSNGKENYPTKLDSPNKPNLDDYILNKFMWN